MICHRMILDEAVADDERKMRWQTFLENLNKGLSWYENIHVRARVGDDQSGSVVGE